MERTSALAVAVLALGLWGCGEGVEGPTDPGAAVDAEVRAASTSAAVKHGPALEDLGTSPGGNARAFGINERGDVVGVTFGPTQPERAFRWTRKGGFEDLGTLGGATSFANGINARGDVVGRASRSGDPGRAQAFLWSEREGIQDLLPTLDIRTEAFAINARGDVAGTLGTIPLPTLPRAFVWSPRDGLTELGVLEPGGGTVARAINARGDVVGEASAGPGASEIHGFLWTRGGGLQDLGHLGPVPSNAGFTGINARGHIVGIRVTPGGDRIGVYWTPRGGLVELLPPGAEGSLALGINDRDQVVGAFFYPKDGNGVTRAFLWSPGGGFVVLPELDEANTVARAVSNGGTVAGWSQAPDGSIHAVTWR